MLQWMNKAAELAQGALQKHNQSTAGADGNDAGGQQSSGSFSDMAGVFSCLICCACMMQPSNYDARLQNLAQPQRCSIFHVNDLTMRDF